MEAPPRGPYVRAALFAESIIEEKNGVKTIVRVIDRSTATIEGPDPPADMPTLGRQLNALISLKPGEARGRQSWKLVMERPDGQRLDVGQGTIHFDGGPGRGVDLVMTLQLTFEQEGLYWFDFQIDGSTLTRMPFEVLYNRLETGSTPRRP